MLYGNRIPPSSMNNYIFVASYMMVQINYIANMYWNSGYKGFIRSLQLYNVNFLNA